MATIYKRENVPIITMRLKIPRLTTSLKLEYRKMLSYNRTSRSLEQPLFQNGKIEKYVIGFRSKAPFCYVAYIRVPS